jgi:hypothetical protein
VKIVPSLTQNPTNSLIKNQPTNTGKVLISKLSPTTKRPIKKPTKPSHSKPWPKFIQNTLHITNMTRKVIPLGFAE